MKINKITLSDQKIRISSGLAIVSVQAHISGVFSGEKSECDFRFTRVWSQASSGAWQVVVGHSSIVV